MLEQGHARMGALELFHQSADHGADSVRTANVGQFLAWPTPSTVALTLTSIYTLVFSVDREETARL